MYDCNLIILLVAPDEELRKANETYETLGRNIKMPFVPSVGMTISVGAGTSEQEEEPLRYLELCRKIPQVKGLYHVRDVNYDVDSGEFRIELNGHTFATLEDLHLGIELCKYYGFKIWI